MNWRIIIWILAFSSSALVQRIIPVKVPLSSAWALEVNPAADLAHIFVQGDFDKIEDFALSHGGKSASLSKGSYFLKLSGNDSNTVIPMIK